MIGMSAILVALNTLLAPVELRGGRTVMAPIIDISPDGVQVGGNEPRVIAWDNVRSVDEEWAGRAAPYREISDDAWRARTRLARGDAILAAPLFERLFPRYRDEDGSLALMIAEGVYRCRFGSNDTPGALEAWLVAANLRQLGVKIAGDPALKPLLDVETHLPPEAPPVFINGPDARRVAEATTAWLEAAGDVETPMRRVVVGYQHAALRAMQSGDAADADLAIPDEPGPRFVALIVNAESASAETRATTREALSAYCRGDALGTWREAWARAAIGRSLLMESEREQRLAGVIELLHLPARFADSQTNLTAISLAHAARELNRLGDAQSARHLTEELQLLAPNHQAIDWLRANANAAADTPRPGSSDGESS